MLDALDDERAPMSVPALESATGLRRGPHRAAAAGDRGRRRGRAHRRRLDLHRRRLHPRPGQVGRDPRGAGPRGRHHAGLRPGPRLPDDVPAAGPRRSRPRRRAGAARCAPASCPSPGASSTPPTSRRRARFLRGADIVLDPRKRWPGGVGRKGAIVGASPGGRSRSPTRPVGSTPITRAVAARDSPLSDEVVDGMVKVLTRWQGTLDRAAGGGRAHAVTPSSRCGCATWPSASPRSASSRSSTRSPSPARPHRPTPPPAPRRAPARQPLGRSTVSSSRPGPLLLVDDTYRSGWTMTVAAALLRDAGALGRPPRWSSTNSPVGRQAGVQRLGDGRARVAARPGRRPGARPRPRWRRAGPW